MGGNRLVQSADGRIKLINEVDGLFLRLCNRLEHHFHSADTCLDTLGNEGVV